MISDIDPPPRLTNLDRGYAGWRPRSSGGCDDATTAKGSPSPLAARAHSIFETEAHRALGGDLQALRAALSDIAARSTPTGATRRGRQLRGERACRARSPPAPSTA